MQPIPGDELRRELASVADAAGELERALRRVLLVLPDGDPAARESAAGGAPAWVSPTRSAAAVVVDGEGDLLGAFERGDPRLVFDGPGGFPRGMLPAEERIGLLAHRLVGDVALEVKHARLEEDGGTVDRMLREVLGLLRVDAAGAGLEAPLRRFVAAIEEFPELGARGAEWR
jgi:hypothetical protein